MAETRRATWILIGIALLTVVAHLYVGPAFGFNRDELQTMGDARRLAWGYIAYPPMTPFFARVSLDLFGTSIVGFRLFASLAEAVLLVLAGLMAREMGASERAQVFAGAACVPYVLGAGALMQYVAFDNVCWVLAAYFLIRMLRSEDPRWWVGIGAAVGLGMMAKYAMAFFAAGILVGLLVSDARKFLLSKWIWVGGAVALAVWAPNLVWEARHQFVSFDFLRSIHARDVNIGRANSFLPDQLRMTVAPLWIIGLIFCFRSEAGKRFRAVGWLYVFLFVFFLAVRGRGYYLLAAYPMLYAAGSVWLDLNARAWTWRVAWAVVAVASVLVAVVGLPIGQPGSWMWRAEMGVMDDMKEELGWKELVATVATVRDSIPVQDRGRMAVLTANYSEAGAVDLYGARYGLPKAISPINSFGARGYGNPPPETVIAVGFPRQYLDGFASCMLAGRSGNAYGVANMEARRPDIYVCSGLKEGWAKFWARLPKYG